jgi:hypothetical protein
VFGWMGTHPTSRAWANWIIWALAVLVVVGVASVGSNPSDRTSAQATLTSPAIPGSTLPTPPASTTAHRATSARTTSPATRKRTRTATTTRPRRSGEVMLPSGAVLPDPARTPGAVNPDVMQANIGSTICVGGWTATVRPPSSYTTSLKEQPLASGYAYHGGTSTSDYQEDHLISLELGGSPTSPKNLWPEPYAGSDGARLKDQIENRLHQLVCDHELYLAIARHAIATNWTRRI